MSRVGTIEVDEFLPHPPAVVWNALTDSQRLEQWLGPNTLIAQVGHEFTFDMGRWGTTHCVVLEVREPELLRYTWRNGVLDTEVVWRLHPEGHGTRLLLEHRGFDLDHPVARKAHDGMREGWRSGVMAALHRHLLATTDQRA